MTAAELIERNRRPEHRCVNCDHRRDEHGDTTVDMMCLICPPHQCFYDPMTAEEWAVCFSAAGLA